MTSIRDILIIHWCWCELSRLSVAAHMVYHRLWYVDMQWLKVGPDVSCVMSVLSSVLAQCIVFGRPFVKWFALCYRTIVLSVLPVTLVYCGQMLGRIKMKLGIQVGLGPGHIVLDRNPAPPPPKGHSPPNFRPISPAAKWLHGSRCHLVWRWTLAQVTLC